MLEPPLALRQKNVREPPNRPYLARSTGKDQRTFAPRTSVALFVIARDAIRVLRRIGVSASGTFPRREGGLDFFITMMEGLDGIVGAAGVAPDKLGRGPQRDQRHEVSCKILSYFVVAVSHVTLTDGTVEKSGSLFLLDRFVAEYEDAEHKLQTP